jgi:UDP-N-acetylmuramate dehydrogenase
VPAPAIRHNVDLSTLSSFRLPARAYELVNLETLAQLKQLPPDAGQALVIGGGSNTIFMADWPGRILLNRLRGISVSELGRDAVRVEAAAGENWHQLVRYCIDHQLHGLENLILIPGSVGAAPIQNIGAYGVELADVLESVMAWDWHHGEMISLSRQECGLSYRDSRFKSADRGRFLITSVRLRLKRRFVANSAYQSLAEELTRHRHLTPSPRQLAAAVMRLRRHRLPDPARLPNAGSFFKNPVLPANQASALLEAFPRMPSWPMDNGRIKLAAGWMIERLGFRGFRIGDAGVYRNHALVLVNHGQATAAELMDLIEHIKTAVVDEFGVELEPEPMLAGL